METTQQALHRLYVYDPEEPLALRWRNHRQRARAGDIAGHWHPIRAGSKTIRRYVEISRRRVPLHRAVWIYHEGEPAPKYIGFRNDDPGDCRIENLLQVRNRIHEMSPQAYARWNHLRINYGMTPETYEAMHKEQDGLCAICLKPETLVRIGKPDRLAVDHCHETGATRGLLCTNCNNALGRFADDPAALRRAADYIERWQAAHSRAPLLGDG